MGSNKKMIIRVSGVRGFPGIVSDGEIDDMKGEIDECEKESKRKEGRTIKCFLTYS